MSNLSTKDIKTGGDFTPKTLNPGGHLCKINDVALEDFKFKPGAMNIVLSLEGEELPAPFEGFFINKDKPELGKHKGQVAFVKATEWAFLDGETTSKVPIKRDQEILKWLKQFCKSIGCLDWFDAQDEKHPNVESFLKAFAKDKPFAGKFYRFCIAGKEYTNRGGYTAYELYLPKYKKDATPVEKDDVSTSTLIKFNETDHIKKKKVTSVTDFGASESTTETDFNL